VCVCGWTPCVFVLARLKRGDEDHLRRS
jgi:hypothetical protein